MREREKRRGLCVSGRMGAKWCSGTRDVGATAGQRARLAAAEPRRGAAVGER